MMRRLPGDISEKEDAERMIRVNHAGEYGALRIYAGQLAVLKPGSPGRAAIEEMAAQEQRHLNAFNKLLVAREVRPTTLLPLWHWAGFALGAMTALLGEKAAFACTAAVETVIDDHYAGQGERLKAANDPELATTIEEFRADEIRHRDESLARGADEAPLYPILSGAIQAASRVAIWLSTRV